MLSGVRIDTSNFAGINDLTLFCLIDTKNMYHQLSEIYSLPCSHALAIYFQENKKKRSAKATTFFASFFDINYSLFSSKTYESFISSLIEKIMSYFSIILHAGSTLFKKFLVSMYHINATLAIFLKMFCRFLYFGNFNLK